MERPELEAYADAVLDAHRTAPRGAATLGTQPVPYEELPPAMRLMTKLDPKWEIDRDRFERLKRNGRRNQRLESALGVVELVGLGLLAAVFWTISNTF